MRRPFLPYHVDGPILSRIAIMIYENCDFVQRRPMSRPAAAHVSLELRPCTGTFSWRVADHDTTPFCDTIAFCKRYRVATNGTVWHAPALRPRLHPRHANVRAVSRAFHGEVVDYRLRVISAPV